LAWVRWASKPGTTQGLAMCVSVAKAVVPIDPDLTVAKDHAQASSQRQRPLLLSRERKSVLSVRRRPKREVVPGPAFSDRPKPPPRAAPPVPPSRESHPDTGGRRDARGVRRDLGHVRRALWRTCDPAEGSADLDFTRSALIELESGLVAGLVRYARSPQRGTELHAPEQSTDPESALHEFLTEFGLDERDVTWVLPQPPIARAAS
jgi:hypothetical protein